MFIIKGDPKKVEDRVTGVTRITLLEADGSETVINVSEDLHFIFGFVKCGKEGGVDVPAELIVKGDVGIVGELFFQAGNQHPELIAHYVRRSTEMMAKKVMEEIKRSGADPIGEALKKIWHRSGREPS